MSHMSLPSKSALAASTIPAAVVALGYIFMSKGDQTQSSSSNSNNSRNNSNSSAGISSSFSHQFSQSSFNSQLQEKLQKVQRSRLDPIEEERDYWN